MYNLAYKLSYIIFLVMNMKNSGYEQYNEKKQHGTPDFPIEIYLLSEGHPQYVMPPHWHKELEIIKVVSGKLELYINDVLYEISQGDIFIVNSKFLHRAVPKKCEYECVVFDLKFLTKMNNAVYAEYIHPIISGNLIIDDIYKPDGSELYFALDSIFSKLKEGTRHQKLTVISELFKILELLYLNDNITEHKINKKSNQNDMIIKLLNWIDMNFKEHITLETLSKEAGLTPNYLCRIFKSFTGKSPIEYVNFIRIQNICQELRWSEKSITEIATDNGFNDISYFCKVFKKQMGVSAKKYSE